MLAGSEWIATWCSSSLGMSAVGLREATVRGPAAAPARSLRTFLDEKYMELRGSRGSSSLRQAACCPRWARNCSSAFLGRGLISRFGVVLGVGITSLLFGLFHLEPERILWTAILGMAMHVVYLSSKSILAPMTIHFLQQPAGAWLVPIRAGRIMVAHGRGRSVPHALAVVGGGSSRDNCPVVDFLEGAGEVDHGVRRGVDSRFSQRRNPARGTRSGGRGAGATASFVAAAAFLGFAALLA